MEIIVKFGYRTYVFYSQSDVMKARKIYAYCTGDLNDFETQLEKADIDYSYEF